MMSNRVKDLTGCRSGWLEVISYIEGSAGKSKHAKWLCYCHRCGNYTEVESGHLTSSWRPILSCGCLRTNPINTTLEDLTGQTFGWLFVESLAEHGKKNHHAKWNCLCVCGNHTVVCSSDLKKGSTVSCGCQHMSKAEKVINDVLNAFNINNKYEYVLHDLFTKANANPRMDFAIFDEDNNLKCFIEHQGIQHYKVSGTWGKTAREETDQLKKEYCKKIGIPLYEIRYDENTAQKTMEILKTLMLIPCQASYEEGVSTISKESRIAV